ncbi:hypothetical protein DEU56DRAFT_757527 [Suillus clintonianus]|uniref:uncharacterized protein n=1 Tax=Suillus clintonianus TaxID=1904413 RepID=UPI001B85BD08|nr:uncharacterized protein DEU56DRAFT_757527 [Suillus clintonianus]KAG2131636.1 hypothetical protein DEU56DRAFT_757527 [Suillus clintonianus]
MSTNRTDPVGRQMTQLRNSCHKGMSAIKENETKGALLTKLRGTLRTLEGFRAVASIYTVQHQTRSDVLSGLRVTSLWISRWRFRRGGDLQAKPETIGASEKVSIALKTNFMLTYKAGTDREESAPLKNSLESPGVPKKNRSRVTHPPPSLTPVSIELALPPPAESPHKPGAGKKKAHNGWVQLVQVAERHDDDLPFSNHDFLAHVTGWGIDGRRQTSADSDSELPVLTLNLRKRASDSKLES